MKKPMEFSIVECLESGDGFLKGHLYAQVGTNNGIQIQRENDEGDCETFLYATFEDIMDWEGKGKPRFRFVDIKGKQLSNMTFFEKAKSFYLDAR